MYAMQETSACGRPAIVGGTCIMHQTRTICTTAEFISTYQECHEVMTGCPLLHLHQRHGHVFLATFNTTCMSHSKPSRCNPFSPMSGRPVDLPRKEMWFVSRHGRRSTHPLPLSNRTESPLSLIPKLYAQHWLMGLAKGCDIFADERGGPR